jgi:hypothetical protein
VTTCRLAEKKWGVEKAEPAADGERRRGRREKKVVGQVRDDVVTEGGRRAAEISYNFFLGGTLLFVLVGIQQRSSGFHHNETLAWVSKRV